MTLLRRNGKVIRIQGCLFAVNDSIVARVLVDLNDVVSLPLVISIAPYLLMILFDI